jgi:hypothetical protein
LDVPVMNQTLAAMFVPLSSRADAQRNGLNRRMVCGYLKKSLARPLARILSDKSIIFLLVP